MCESLPLAADAVSHPIPSPWLPGSMTQCRAYSGSGSCLSLVLEAEWAGWVQHLCSGGLRQVELLLIRLLGPQMRRLYTLPRSQSGKPCRAKAGGTFLLGPQSPGEVRLAGKGEVLGRALKMSWLAGAQGSCQVRIYRVVRGGDRQRQKVFCVAVSYPAE